MSAEIALIWLGLAGYVIAVVILTAGVLFERERLTRFGLGAVVGGFASHTASIAVRYVYSGRLPVADNYENILAGAWMMVLAYLLLVAWNRRFVKVGVVLMPVVLVTLGVGLTSDPAIKPLTPAYRSGWLVVHVVFAWLTYAAYTVAAAVATLVILGDRAPTRFRRVRDLMPGTPGEVDDLMTRLVGLGFILNGVMIASGSIWAFRLWGSYWAWDPVETWSLITWLAFGLYLHLRLTMGWSGRRLAWIAVLALFGILMSFWGVQFAPTTYHLFRDLGGTVIEQSRPQ